MKDDRTYIKIFHKMLDWGWYGDTNTFRVFMHILLRANYRESEYLGHKIGAGECVFGYNAWADQLGLSVRQIRTAIDHLKSTNEIVVKATNKFSVITVVKWDFWQVEEGGSDKRTTRKTTSNRQTSDKQPTTSKEYKNISSSLRSEDIYIYDDEFEKLWELYPKKQGKKKACENYIKARKGGATSEEVEKGIIAYAEYIKATNTEDRYIKQGSTFFSQQAWQDEWRVRDDIQRPNNRTVNSQRGGFSGSTGRSGASPKIVGATVPRMGVSFEEEE